MKIRTQSDMEGRAARIWYVTARKMIPGRKPISSEKEQFEKMGKDTAWSDRKMCSNVLKPEGISKDMNPGKKKNNSLSFPTSRTSEQP